jgi:hypothetical protein
MRKTSLGLIVAVLLPLAAVPATGGILPTAALAASCPTWSTTLQTMGTITEPTLTEVSGLVASTDQPGIFWLIEDSSNGPNLWAINSSAAVVGHFILSGAVNLDWEDIAIDRLPGTDQILIPDIGDIKKANRDGVHRIVPAIYQLPEPTVSASGPPVTATVTNFERFNFRYGDEAGNVLPPLNAETFLVDPVTHGAYVIQKTSRTVSGKKQFWVFELPTTMSQTTLNLAAKVGYVTKQVVAGDISPDGQYIVTKDYSTGFLWPRNGTVEQTFAANPAPLCQFTPVDRAEGLAWAPDGLWMIAEGSSPPVHRLAAA